GAVVVYDAARGAARLVRLAPPRGAGVVFESRKAISADAEKPIVSATVVTIVSLGVEKLRRHDVVLYEVSRGQLTALTLALPQGIDPIRAATDEGEVPPVLNERELRIERSTKLTADGYVV